MCYVPRKLTDNVVENCQDNVEHIWCWQDISIGYKLKNYKLIGIYSFPKWEIKLNIIFQNV